MMVPTTSRRVGASARAQYLCQRTQSTTSTITPKAHGTWSADEHDRFLQGMEKYPMGPWSAIAEVVGTRSVRQVHSHAQKYAAKVERHKRGQGKMKRSREEVGGCRHTGHRVVTKIPGKFVNRAAPSSPLNASEQSDDSSSRSFEDEGDDDADGVERQTPCMEATIGSPHKVGLCSSRSPSSIRGFQDQLLRQHDTSSPLSHFHLTSHKTTSDVLPTLDESLDFLINHFLLSDDAFDAVDVARGQDKVISLSTLPFGDEV